MRLATFSAGGADELGIVDGERVICLSRAAPKLARDMIDLISRWREIERDVRGVAQGASQTVELAKVRLRAPIPRPGKILAIGLNYADHIEETKQPKPEHQIWFSKMPSAVNGPFDPIVISRAGENVDYEAELVVLIGKNGRNVSREAAASFVFGYCCGNDVTERAWQFRTSQWILGKSFDTHAPIGPWITTSDEVGDPHALGIRCFVNGEKRQDSNTRNLVFNVWDQIEHLSKVMTLEPGDLLFTGTPGGVGAAMRPPKFLKSGDHVRVEIDRLGAIEAGCAAEESERP
jgi:2-keto-4-pentenoate hydratase/2-oxohepta-3-ene-1,7-dioic acid hydratase in catechol pathway